jgi:hypothetical protein
VDVSGLEKLLFSVHLMAATALKVPELALEPKEAEQLSEAASRVLAHYPVNIAPQSMDVVNLIVAMAMIYGSRIAAIRVRTSRKGTAPMSGAPSAETPSNVVNMTFVPPGAAI